MPPSRAETSCGRLRQRANCNIARQRRRCRGQGGAKPRRHCHMRRHGPGSSGTSSIAAVPPGRAAISISTSPPLFGTSSCGFGTCSIPTRPSNGWRLALCPARRLLRRRCAALGCPRLPHVETFRVVPEGADSDTRRSVVCRAARLRRMRQLPNSGPWASLMAFAPLSRPLKAFRCLWRRRAAPVTMALSALQCPCPRSATARQNSTDGVRHRRHRRLALWASRRRRRVPRRFLSHACPSLVL